MTPGISVSGITFSDGTTVSLASTDRIIIVGPNNVGKTAALNEIFQRLQNPRLSPKVITSISIDKRGNGQDVIDWLENTGRRSSPPGAEVRQYSALGVASFESHFRTSWESPSGPIRNIATLFSRHLTVEDRLKAVDPVAAIPIVRGRPTQLLHYLQSNEGLERRLSDLFHEAFGEELILARFVGQDLRLYLGNRALAPEQPDPSSYEYAEALEQLPLLHAQGHGMRAFATILLNALVDGASLILIDEPEMFLHPPQSRALAKFLVGEPLASSQVFLATHSGDILRGALEAGSPSVRVLRITREGQTNHVSQLDNARVVELWSNPLVRNSNILDALFHESVVICEGDSDARFYSAVAEAVREGAERRRPDIMFTSCGGVDRIPVAVKALRALGLPVASIVDFDTFSRRETFSALVAASGGDWDALRFDWTALVETLTQSGAGLTADGVKRLIGGVLQEVSEDVFPDDAKRRIRQILRKSSPWASAGADGMEAVPEGGPTEAARRLLAGLAAIGIYVVEVGELESFVKTVGGEGTRWVSEVLTRNLAVDPELSLARDFVRRVVPVSQ